MSPIKLVTFDALHTIITPRLPIAVQYARTFEPYLGPLDPDLLKSSFKRGELYISLASSTLEPLNARYCARVDS